MNRARKFLKFLYSAEIGEKILRVCQFEEAGDGNSFNEDINFMPPIDIKIDLLLIFGFFFWFKADGHLYYIIGIAFKGH